MRLTTAIVVALALSAGIVAATKAQDGEPAYVVRGRQTEANQRALKERTVRFYNALVEALERDAPDLLPNLEPPPAGASGYMILPRVLPDSQPGPPSKPHVVSYSWSWSDKLIARSTATLKGLEAELASISAAGGNRAAYSTLVADYRKAVDNRRSIDADVDYNWLWQKQIAANRPLFDRLTAQLNVVVDRQARGEPITPQAAPPLVGFEPPSFVSIDPPNGHEQVVRVSIYTDLDDPAVVESLKSGIETRWQVRDGEDVFRLRLTVEVIPPERLYCRRASAGRLAAPSCSPPAKGEHIDLAAHVARFPKDGAVLTTGAASLQLVGGRAIVLSPHDVTPRVVAHEFGHILGFSDAYLRGYKDLGIDGFQIMEFVPDYTDIMAAPGTGSATPRHFRDLVAAKEIVTIMQSGLAALYARNDPVEAEARFRLVLEKNPAHYGATLQLAKALDKAGRTDEALAWWNKMLGMADSAGDAATARMARDRLARHLSPPQETGQ